MCGLGVHYQNGEGCVQNSTTAAEWYEKSANSGYCPAMYNIGYYCYEEGEGVTKDLNKAREWYTKAVAQGHATAQILLDQLNASNN